MEAHKKIEVNPEIMFGKPAIKGTRITVEQILRKLAHPHLKLDDIHAAEAFAL